MVRLNSDLTADDICLAAAEELQLCLQATTIGNVVGIHSSDDRCATQPRANVCGVGDALMRDTVDSHSRICELRKNGCCVIRGTVIHRDELEVTQRLIQNRLDGFTNGILSIEYREHDRYLWGRAIGWEDRAQCSLDCERRPGLNYLLSNS